MARDNVPPHNRHLMGHSEFLYGLKLICLPLNISELQAWRGRDSSNSSCILKNNIQHRNIERLSKRRPPHFSHSDTNFVLGNALVHPFKRKPCSGCNSGINLVVVLEYAFLQLYSNVEQIS